MRTRHLFRREVFRKPGVRSQFVKHPVPFVSPFALPKLRFYQDKAAAPSTSSTPLTEVQLRSKLVRQCKTTDDVSKLVSGWIREGVELDSGTWRPVLGRLAYLGDYEKCNKLFDKLKSNPQNLCAAMFTTMIRNNLRTPARLTKLGRHGAKRGQSAHLRSRVLRSLQKSMDIYDEMKEDFGVEPNLGVISALLQNCINAQGCGCDEESVAMAEALWDEANNEGPAKEQFLAGAYNSGVWDVMVNVYFRYGLFDKGLAMFKAMTEKNIKPTPRTMPIIMNGFKKEMQRVNAARKRKRRPVGHASADASSLQCLGSDFDIDFDIGAGIDGSSDNEKSKKKSEMRSSILEKKAKKKKMEDESYDANESVWDCEWTRAEQIDLFVGLFEHSIAVCDGRCPHAVFFCALMDCVVSVFEDFECCFGLYRLLCNKSLDDDLVRANGILRRLQPGVGRIEGGVVDATHSMTHFLLTALHLWLPPRRDTAIEVCAILNRFGYDSIMRFAADVSTKHLDSELPLTAKSQRTIEYSLKLVFDVLLSCVDHFEDGSLLLTEAEKGQLIGQSPDDFMASITAVIDRFYEIGVHPTSEQLDALIHLGNSHFKSHNAYNRWIIKLLSRYQ